MSKSYIDILKTAPKNGDVYGRPDEGHRVHELRALVMITPDGDEGLVSAYAFDDDGRPTARSTFVSSTDTIATELDEMAKLIQVPEGYKLEWRLFTFNPEEKNASTDD